MFLNLCEISNAADWSLVWLGDSADGIVKWISPPKKTQRMRTEKRSQSVKQMSEVSTHLHLQVHDKTQTQGAQTWVHRSTQQNNNITKAERGERKNKREFRVKWIRIPWNWNCLLRWHFCCVADADYDRRRFPACWASCVGCRSVWSHRRARKAFFFLVKKKSWIYLYSNYCAFFIFATAIFSLYTAACRARFGCYFLCLL